MVHEHELDAFVLQVGTLYSAASSQRVAQSVDKRVIMREVSISDTLQIVQIAARLSKAGRGSARELASAFDLWLLQHIPGQLRIVAGMTMWGIKV